jgi:hypothetical protein
MKQILSIIITIAVLSGCATQKETAPDSVNHVLFSEYNEYVDGEITLTVVNDTKLNCDSNIVKVEISSIKPENTIVSIAGGAWSRENQPESHYLLMPSCKGSPYLNISYRTDDNKIIMIKKIELKPYMAE